MALTVLPMPVLKKDIHPGLICVGAFNKQSFMRGIEWAVARRDVNDGIECPLTKWIAQRICGEDKQDCTIAITARKGAGKSITALRLCEAISESVARIKGGKSTDYFSINNVLTLEDFNAVVQRLLDMPMHSVICLDDATTFISNREFQSKANKSFNALMTVCRTRRLCLVYTTVFRKNIDVQARELVDLWVVIDKSLHKEGMNLIKVYYLSIGQMGHEYSRFVDVDGVPVQGWFVGRPSKELESEYHEVRDRAAIELNARIVQTGSYVGNDKKPRPEYQKPSQSKREATIVSIIKDHETSIRADLASNPNRGIYDLCSRYNVSYSQMKTVIGRLGLDVQPAKRVRKPKEDVYYE